MSALDKRKPKQHMLLASSPKCHADEPEPINRTDRPNKLVLRYVTYNSPNAFVFIKHSLYL